MSLSFGFFDSMNGDRRYSAQDFSELISSLVTEGVFENVGNHFSVTPYDSTATQVIGGIYLDTGRCWFRDIWIKNDSKLLVRCGDTPASGKKRYDLICLSKNSGDRTAEVKVIPSNTVSEASTPNFPSYTANDLPIAYVVRTYNEGYPLPKGSIKSLVGSSRCPFVTATLPINDITNVLGVWDSEFDEWFQTVKDNYEQSGGAPVPEVVPILIPSKALPSDTNVTLASFDLQKGLYHFSINVMFDDSGTSKGRGQRQLRLRCLPAWGNNVRLQSWTESKDSIAGLSTDSGYTYVRLEGIIYSTSAKSYVLDAWQNSGVASSIFPASGTIVKLSSNYVLKSPIGD